MELLMLGLSSSLYAIAISVGWGRRFTQHIATLPVVVAGGVLLVLVAVAWNDPALFQRLFLAFAVAGTPMAIRAAVLHVLEHERARLEQHRLPTRD